MYVQKMKPFIIYTRPNMSVNVFVNKHVQSQVYRQIFSMLYFCLFFATNFDVPPRITAIVSVVTATT